MANLTLLQQKAIERAIECAVALQKGISENGECELKDDAYDFASLKLLEIKHWLEAIVEDAK